MSDMRFLRAFNLLAGICFFSYNYTRSPRSTDAAAWNVVFLCLNSFMLYRYLTEHNEVAFTNEELDVFEKYFLPAGLSPRRFRTLLALGQWQLLPSGTEITETGKPVRQLVFLTRGRVDLLQHGDTVAHYHGGDRDAVIGLESFLSYVSALRRLAALGEQQHKKSGRTGPQSSAEGIHAEGLEGSAHEGCKDGGCVSFVPTHHGQTAAELPANLDTLGKSLGGDLPGSPCLMNGKEKVHDKPSELSNPAKASFAKPVARGGEQEESTETAGGGRGAPVTKGGASDLTQEAQGGKAAGVAGAGREREQVHGDMAGSSKTHEPNTPSPGVPPGPESNPPRPGQVAMTDGRARDTRRDVQTTSSSPSSPAGGVAESVSSAPATLPLTREWTFRDDGDQEDEEEEALFSEDDSSVTGGRRGAPGGSVNRVCRQTLPSYVHEASVVSEDEEDQDALLLSPPTGRFPRAEPRKGEEQEEEAGSTAPIAQVQQIAETLQTGCAAQMTTVCVTDCEVLLFDIEEIAKAVLDDPVKVGFPVLQGLASLLVERSFAQVGHQRDPAVCILQ